MHIEYEYPSITFLYDEDIDLSLAKVEQHEARWREIKEKYESVRVYLLYGLHALAEFLYRLRFTI